MSHGSLGRNANVLCGIQDMIKEEGPPVKSSTTSTNVPTLPSITLVFSES